MSRGPRRPPSRSLRGGARPARYGLAWRVVLLWLAANLAWAQLPNEAGKIMRPPDSSALPAGEVSIVATAPAGKLELDGQPIEAEEPFANVFHAKLTPAAGEHRLTLVWDGGRKEVRFFVGENAPAEFKPFQDHPPVPGVECTQCHGVSRRGRFRFKGGCFDCHEQEPFVGVHAHPVHDFVECGQCHNAHGSTAAKHLILPREVMCKLCHN